MHGRSPNPALVAVLETLLRERHAGEASAATARVLLGELGERGWDGLHLRRIGEAVAELRVRGVPVASSSVRPPGYYLVEDARQANAVVRELDTRISSLFRTRQAFKRAATADTSPQLRLFAGEVSS